MKQFKKLFSLLLAAVMLCASLPFTSSATEALTVETVPTGNTGAVLTANRAVSASSDSELINVAVNDKTVTVTAVDGAVGTASVLVTDGSETIVVEVPVGYTAFYFNDDSLTVFNGSDDNYEISGINRNNEEYLVGDAAFPLEETQDEYGNSVYRNTDSYSINVGIKKKGGVYVFYGESDDMTITVKKEAANPATLLLAGLDLKSSFTSPVTIKKNSTSTVELTALAGYANTLEDADLNNADKYGDTEQDGGDGTNVDYAESAVIKGKDYSQLTIDGTGVLNLICNTKNAVKIGAYGSLTIKDITLNVTSAKNGISSDNTLTVLSGTINVNSDSDGIRTDPDTVDADAGTAGIITINGGSITITAGSDGIQSAQDLIITGGTFDITAGAGFNDANFDKDTMSCKGLKASYNNDTGDEAATEATNLISISGGTFNLNCADDAVHSDAYIEITGGEFNIQTGDDGVHADTTLNIGTNGADNSELFIDVKTCYEGLEAGTLNIMSGTIKVLATDDGINSAGGSDSSDNPGGGFNPGGGWGPGGWGPGGRGYGAGAPGDNNGSSNSDYSLNISGGDIYVNASGDGFDSNGTMDLTGGNIIVWGQQNGGDNEPLDCDGAITINGASVFAAGSYGMGVNFSGGSQTYVTYRGNTIASGRTIMVQHNGETVFSTTAVKNAGYVLYSSPDMTSSSGWSITSSSDATAYSITIASMKNGTVKADSTTARAGDKVTLTVEPNSGYQLVSGSLSVTGVAASQIKGSGSTYTFTMPGQAVTVNAKFEASNRSRLDEAIENLETNYPNMADKYTEESVSDVNSALERVEGLKADPDATYEDIDEAVDTLNEALNNLVEKDNNTDPTDPTDPDIPVNYGDVNGDGNIDASDATLVLQRYAGIIDDNSAGYVPNAADVNSDGEVDASDATLILQKYANIITVLPSDK